MFFTFKRCGHYNTCVVLTTHKVFIPSVWVLPHMCAQYHAPRVQSEIRRSPGFFHGSLEISIPPGKNHVSIVCVPPGIFHGPLEISIPPGKKTMPMYLMWPPRHLEKSMTPPISSIYYDIFQHLNRYRPITQKCPCTYGDTKNPVSERVLDLLVHFCFWSKTI